jgi:hypothetical protein
MIDFAYWKNRFQYVREFTAMGVTWFVAYDRLCGQKSPALNSLDAAIGWLSI